MLPASTTATKYLSCLNCTRPLPRNEPAYHAAGRQDERAELRAASAFLRDVTVGNIDRVGSVKGAGRTPATSEGHRIIFAKASAQRELSKNKMSDPA